MSRFTVSLLAIISGVSAFRDPVRQGPTRLSDLNVRALLTRAAGTFDIVAASELLGQGGVIDCPGYTHSEDASMAKNKFLNEVDFVDLTLSPGSCRHVLVNTTMARVCNRATDAVSLKRDVSDAAFNVITTTCTHSENTGTLKLESGLFYAIYTQAMVAPAQRKLRNSKVRARDCANQVDILTNGCITTVCDPVVSLNSDGSCPFDVDVDDGDSTHCTWYCEVNAAKYYGPFEAVDNTQFCSNGGCTLTLGTSYTVEKALSIGFSLEGGPGDDELAGVLGAEIGYSYAVAYTTSTEEDYPLGDGNCGQWYKAPVLKHSCGSISQYDPNTEDGGPICSFDGSDLLSTTGNCCTEIQAKRLDGDAPDAVILTRIGDCGSREFLDDNDPNQAMGWKSIYGAGLNAPAHTC